MKNIILPLSFIGVNMKISLNFILLIFWAFCVIPETSAKGDVMKIKISTSEVIAHGVLEDNATARGLYSQLPLTVKLEDYASTEKIFYPPEKLSLEGAPAGYKPQVGDITCYGPWGNIAIFYKDFSYASGLIKLGRITGGLTELKKISDGKVKVEKE